jgi:hypothetical protein
MATSPYACRQPRRVAALRAAAAETPPRLLNGIEFLEVAPDQLRLDVHFVHSLALVPATPLGLANVELRGGTRVRDPKVSAISVHDEVLQVFVATPGDFSRYRLRLVASGGAAAPPDGIDPALAEIEFSFKVDCPSDFDCRERRACAPELAGAPLIDYLARDFASFRRLLLDRLSALMPGWRERSAADLWVTLAELVAFRADELAYYQDAVATEAYLGTARSRVSVRRHARLLDYDLHEGCNARAWVAFTVAASADGRILPGCDGASGIGGTLLLTQAGLPGAVLSAAAAHSALDDGAAAFELLHDLVLYAGNNAAPFHTWSDEECCLPRGATRAWLLDEGAARLRLRAGDLLVLEARRHPDTGEEADADRRQRHVVRLTRVDPEAPLAALGKRGLPAERRDPVGGRRVVEIEWGAADALPFPLCVSRRVGGTLLADMALAFGNVALADHGRTIGQAETLAARADGRARRHALAATAPAPLTWQARVRAADGAALLVDPAAPAAAALQGQAADAGPALDLRSEGDRRRWSARRDLLASGPLDDAFVVETEDDGRAVLRFGDGVNGRAPPDGEALVARYRLGSGSEGNVGAEAIAHVVDSGPGIVALRNPLAAAGGVAPHPTALAKLYAPQAFRRQLRAVTPADYAAAAGQEPRVQRAVATRRWTGSWHTMFVSVDPRAGVVADARFEQDLRDLVERFRLAGHDVEFEPPRYVALDIALHLCIKDGYFAAQVHERLLDAFSAGPLATGGSGFFDPDRFSFGQPVYLSALVAHAMRVPGVDYVTALRFQRQGRAAAGELESGRIVLARLEVARLDNDPNAPEHGRIEFALDGGR